MIISVSARFLCCDAAGYLLYWSFLTIIVVGIV